MIKKSSLHLDRINEKLSKFDLVVSTVIIFQFLFAINVILAYINEFYFQYPMGEILSLAPYDPPGNVNLDMYTPSLWGVHFFGDFLAIVNWSQFENPWLETLVNYPPLPIKLIGILNVLPYSVALKIYLFCLFASLVMPFVILFAKFKRLIFLAALFSIGFLNFPLLTSMDRGNVVGFLPLLMFLAGIAILNSKYYIAAVFIALGISIKIYPIILLAVFVSNKKWKELFLCLALTTVGIFGLLSTYPGNKFQTTKRLMIGFLEFARPSANLNVENANVLTCRNYSFIGGLIRLSERFELAKLSSFIQANTVLISVVTLSLIIYLIFSRFTETWLKIVISLSSFTLVPIVTYSYSFGWAIAAIGLTLFDYQKKKKQQGIENFSKHSQHWITAILLIPIVVPWAFVDTNYSTVCSASYFPKIYSIIVILSFGLLLSRDFMMRSKVKIKNI